MTVVGLDHVQLAMPPGGEDRARAFFVGVLGMEEVPKPAVLAARGGAWFVSRGAALHIGIEEPFTPARKAHAALLVDNVDRVEQRLHADGHPFERDAAVAGVRRGYTTDPFGNRIELIQDGEGSTQIAWR